jgi:hypothetical protein
MRCNEGAPVGRVLGLGMVVACSLLAGCAMKPSTLPKVTLGNTGCQPEALAVFNYDANTRSWMAVCGEQLFSCSDAGRRTARCSPMAETAATPAIRRRAPLLLKLPRDVRTHFVSTRITQGSFQDFVWRLALVATMPRDKLDALGDPSRLYVYANAQEHQALMACGTALIRVRVDAASGNLKPQGYALHYADNPDCYRKALDRLRATPDQRRLGQIFVYTGRAYASILAALDAPAEESEPALAPVAPAEHATDDAPARAQDAPDLEARIRAHLDAHREDVLACVNAPRAVLQVAYAPDGKAVVSLQGAEAGGPLEGCVRAVLGAIPVQGADEPGTVVHLVR